MKTIAICISEIKRKSLPEFNQVQEIIEKWFETKEITDFTRTHLISYFKKEFFK